MSIEYTTSAAVESVAMREEMLSWLSDYYPKAAKDTNIYKILTAFADILTDVDNEIDLTILDMGIDEARETALYKNFGELFDINLKSNLYWGWDDYRFYLKVLLEAYMLYGSTAYGMRRVIQVATGISPYILEHYKYAGWILNGNVLGATTVVETGDYTWNSVDNSIFTSYNLYDISAIQMSDVYVCGDDGVKGGIFRNINGTWQDLTPDPTMLATSFYGVSATTKQNVWTCGYNLLNGGLIYRYNIPTATWSVSNNDPGNSTFRDIWMYNDLIGWTVGEHSSILYTVDGVTWNSVIPITVDTFYGVYGFNNQNVYIVGNNTVIKWDGIAYNNRSPAPVQFWRGVYAISANDVWICGLSGWVSHTTDGGVTWNPQQPNATTKNLFGIWVSPDGTHIRVCGEDDTVIISIDSGTTWTQETVQCIGSNLQVIDMSSNNTMGYICGSSTVGQSGTLLRNNGQSPGFTLPNKLFSMDTSYITVLNTPGIISSTSTISTIFTTNNYPLSSNAVLNVDIASKQWYIIDGDHSYKIVNEFLELNVYTYANTVYSNGELIYGAILESRYGRRNSIDLVCWNVKDHELVQQSINDMKPAHIKINTIYEYPFLIDYYYDIYYEDVYTGNNIINILPQGNETVIVINGRGYGDEMSRITYGTDEVNIPQLED
jgi:hypothetical protein